MHKDLNTFDLKDGKRKSLLRELLLGYLSTIRGECTAIYKDILKKKEVVFEVE